MSISDEIFQAIRNTKQTSIPISKASNLYTELRFDSLEFIELLLQIEEAYSISFAIEEMEMCVQVDQLIALVEQKVRGDCVRNDQTITTES